MDNNAVMKWYINLTGFYLFIYFLVVYVCVLVCISGRLGPLLERWTAAVQLDSRAYT